MDRRPLPQAAVLAGHLNDRLVPAVVVGGTAAWLADAAAPWPHDLDILLPPLDSAVTALGEAIADLQPCTRTRWPRSGDELTEFEPWQVRTTLGALDVFALRRPMERTKNVQLGGHTVTFAPRRPLW